MNYLYQILFVNLARAVISEADCANPKNRIIAENCLEGDDSRSWDINGDGDPSI